jgi:prevent-host-death family protein
MSARVGVVVDAPHHRVSAERRIAELKARLSEYLRAVRRGETIGVLDRETPVAQIVPIRDRKPQVPAALAEVVDRAVDDDLNRRYSSAKEFRDALSKAL